MRRGQFKRLCALLLALVTIMQLGASAQGAILPARLLSIAEEAFRGDRSLMEATIPDGCGSIGPYAFADCVNLRKARIPDSVTFIGPNAFLNCPLLTLYVESDYAAQWAEASQIPFEIIDSRYRAESDEWFMAPTLTGVSRSGSGVKLTWQGNGVADAYGVYERFEGDQSLLTMVGDTQATLYGVSKAAHTYFICPIRRTGSENRVGMASNALSIDLTQSEDWRESVKFTYADQTEGSSVTLRWKGDAPRYEVVELIDGAASEALARVEATEATITDVSSGRHVYAVRSLFEDGTTALSEGRGVQVYGAADRVIISADKLTLYPAQTAQLTAEAQPFDGPDTAITWSSANPEVATISEDGVVTGVAGGKADIVAATAGGVSARCTVTVLPGGTIERDGFHVTDGVLTKYDGLIGTPNVAAGVVEIPSDLGIWKIGNGAFLYRYAITDIVIPDTVTTIDNYAFFGSNIEKLTLPDSVTIIGKEAFNQCRALKTLVIPENVREIGEKAFAQGSLETVEIRCHAEKCGANIFYNNDNLRSVTFAGPDVRFESTLAFQSCDSIEEVNFNAGKCTIAHCFNDREGALKRLNFAGGETVIGESAFFRCYGLTELDLKGVTSIGPGAFADCTALTGVKTYEGLESIGYRAFYCCSELSDIDLADSIESISEEAFYKCKGDETLRLPKSLISLGRYAFYTWPALERLEIASSNLSIPEDVFYRCQGLKTVVVSGDKVTLTRYSFEESDAIEEVEITGDDVTIDSAFQLLDSLRRLNVTGRGARIGTSSNKNLSEVNLQGADVMIDYLGYSPALTHITLNEGFKLSDIAFAHCENLTCIDVNASNVTFDPQAFYCCDNIKVLNLRGDGITVPTYNEIDTSGMPGIETINIIGDNITIKRSNFIQGNAKKSINITGDNAILEDYSISGTVESLNVTGNNATIGNTFYNKGLTSLYVNSRGATLGSFGMNSGLTSTILLGVSSLPPFNSTGLTHIDIPDAVQEIKDNTFSYCSNLRDVNIGPGIERIGKYAFSNCRSLELIDIPDSVTEIDEYAFNNDANLREVSLEEGLKSIGRNAFYGTGLTHVHIPDSVTDVGINAFYCNSMETLEIGGGLSVLHSYTFKSDSLKSVVIPPSVVTIETAAISGENKNYTIYGVEGSAAQTYAQKNKIAFAPIADYIASQTAPEQQPTDDLVLDADNSVLMCTGMTVKLETLFGSDYYRLATDSYTSSAPGVADVVKGRVQATGKGETTISATRTDTGETVTRHVRVPGGFTQVLLDMVPGEQARLTWDADDSVTPGEPYIYHLTSAIPDYVTLAADGTVDAVKAGGIVPSYIRMDMGTGLYSECSVNVWHMPTQVYVDPATLILGVKDERTLTASVSPSEARRGYTFYSSNPDVASVDANTGLVRALSEGSAVISADACNGVFGICEVKVLPEGMDDETLASYMNGIDSAYQALYNMSLSFTREGFDYINHADGTETTAHMDGIDIDELVKENFQAVYTVLAEGPVEGTMDNVFRNTTSAYYLADLIMNSLATRSAPKEMVISEAKEIISYIKTFGDVGDSIVYMIQMYEHCAGKIKLESNDWHTFDKYYKDNGMFADSKWQGKALKGITVYGDICKALSALANVYGKYVVYKSVDPDQLREYADALSQSTDPAVRAAGALLEGFNSEDCIGMLMGFYGFPTFSKLGVKYLMKALSKIGLAADEIPYIGEIMMTAELGGAVGNGVNSIFLNMDDFQKALLRSYYIVNAANAYRPQVEAYYNQFKRDPLDAAAFMQFANASKAFGELVGAEYEAFAELPKSKDKQFFRAIRNFFVGSAYAEQIANTEECAGLARSMMYGQLSLYARDMLDIQDLRP